MRVPCLCLVLLCVAAQARFPDNRDRKNFVLCAFKSTELCIKRELMKDVMINIKDHIFSDQYVTCGVSDLKPIKYNTRLYKISSLKHINGQFRIIYCKHIYSGSSDSIIIPRHADDFVRQKRQSPRGRYRGQTQSQYLAMDQQKDEEGKAEAHAAPDSSRATVTGRSGIGQAQSQTSYDPLCDNCDEQPQYIVDKMPRRPQRTKGRGGPAAGNTGTLLPGGYVPNSRTTSKKGHPSYPGSRNVPASGSSEIGIPTGNRASGGPTNDRNVPYSENTQFEGAPQQTNVGRNAYDPQRNVGSGPGRKHGSSNKDKVRPGDRGYQNNYRQIPSSNKFGQSGAPQTPGDETISGTNLIDRRPSIPGTESNSNSGANSNGRLPYNSGNTLMPPLGRSHPSDVGNPSEASNSYGGPEHQVTDHGYLPIGSLTTGPRGNVPFQQRIPGLIPGVLTTDSNGVVYVCCPMNQIGTYAGSPPMAAPHGQLIPQHQRPVTAGAGQYPPGYQQQPQGQIAPNQRGYNTPALYAPDVGVGHVQQAPTNLKPGIAGIRPNTGSRYTPGVSGKPFNNKPGILGEYIPEHIPAGVGSQFPSMYAPGNLNYLPAGQGIYYPGIIPTLPHGVLPGNIYSPGYNQGYQPNQTSRPGYETGGWKPDYTKQVYMPKGVTDTGKSVPSTHRQVQQPQDEHNTDPQPHDQFETGQNVPNQYGNVQYPQAPNVPDQQSINQFDIGNYPQNSGQHPQVLHYPDQQQQEQYETGQHPQAHYGPGQQPLDQYETSLYPQGPYNPSQNSYGQYAPSQQPHVQYGLSQQPHGQYGLSQQPHGQYGPGEQTLGQTTLRPDENIYSPELDQDDISPNDKSGHISPGGEPYNEEIYGPSPYGAIGSGRPVRPEAPVDSEQNGRNGLDVGATDTGYGQYEPNTPGAGQGPSNVHQYGHEGQNASGINNVQDREVIASKDIPQNVLDSNSIIDDDDSEAQATISQASNGTLASASSKGGNNKGRAQTQVQGSYTGGGSFSAQAQITDDRKGAESQVNGGKQGALSSAQGKGRNNKSQAQVELGSETGSLQTQAQSEGVMHSSNSQVQGSVKGGMADAQARGPGSTSSQAQIGFTPYKEGDKLHEQLKSPFTGSGSASAQSSGRIGQSQSQLQGVFKYGIKYNGAAQSGSSLDKDAVFPNRLSYNKIDVFDKNNTNIDVDRLEDMNSISETPNINEENEPTESSEIKNVNHPHSDHHNEESHSPVNNRRSFNYNHKEENEYETEKYEGAADDYDVEAGYGGEVDPEYPNYDEFSQSPTHQSLENTRKKGLNVKQSSSGNTQHIVLGSLNNHDAEITQQNSEQHPDETRIYQPGERVPGTGGYTIPIGFTGSVKSVASKGKTYAIGTRDSPSQAQTVSLTPGTGKINYNHPKTNSRTINPKNLKSLDSNNRKIEDDNRYISVSKSITGALDSNNKVKQQYSHTYYTKSSSCGYFAFTCTIVSGSKGKRKICTPKVHTNPDGTPMNC